MILIEAVNHHTQSVRLLQDHFKEDSITGIELGTAEGLLTKALLLCLPNLEMIYSIDPYLFVPGAEFEAGINGQDWHDDRYAQAVMALSAFSGRYTHLRTTSDFATTLTPTIVDFVWVDGGHSTDQVTKDIENYYPKVKSGGIFGGHDSQIVLPLVKSLITEEITTGQDLTWWCIKK